MSQDRMRPIGFTQQADFLVGEDQIEGLDRLVEMGHFRVRMMGAVMPGWLQDPSQGDLGSW